MNYQEIRDLTEWLENSSFTTYSLNLNGVELSVSKQYDTTLQTQQLPVLTSSAVTELAPHPTKQDFGGHVIISPIVGTFYASANPEIEAFVQVGQSVKTGDVLCILEAMKVMNEITSDVDGIVAEIYVSNGDMVESRMPLFKIAR